MRRQLSKLRHELSAHRDPNVARSPYLMLIATR
jgi:hypothetical protein